MPAENLDEIPVVLEMQMTNTNENSKALDTDNYPFVGGTSALLANKIVKVSHIFIDMTTDAVNVLEYVKLDDNWVIDIPFAFGAFVPGQQIYEINVKTFFGRDHLACRDTVATKLSAYNSGTVTVWLHGVASDRNQ
jgi:hypothetical protein